MEDDYDRPRPEWAGEPELLEGDREMAREIALFIADRAFTFEDRECRAWALTDFGVWAELAGMEPELNLREQGRSDPSVGNG